MFFFLFFVVFVFFLPGAVHYGFFLSIIFLNKRCDVTLDSMTRFSCNFALYDHFLFCTFALFALHDQFLFCTFALFALYGQFLALLDSVSRGHGMEFLSVVRRPSGRPSSVSQLSLNLMHGFLSNFSCGFPWAIR